MPGDKEWEDEIIDDMCDIERDNECELCDKPATHNIRRDDGIWGYCDDHGELERRQL